MKEDEVIQQKKHQKEQDDIKHLKEFIASAGTYANLVKQIRTSSCCSLLLSTNQHSVRSLSTSHTMSSCHTTSLVVMYSMVHRVHAGRPPTSTPMDVRITCDLAGCLVCCTRSRSRRSSTRWWPKG